MARPMDTVILGKRRGQRPRSNHWLAPGDAGAAGAGDLLALGKEAAAGAASGLLAVAPDEDSSCPISIHVKSPYQPKVRR